MSGKRLYRSTEDRMIAGVCGGLGDYFSIDATLIRLALLFLVIWGGGGLLVYIIAWIVIPEAPLTQGTPATESATDLIEAKVEETAAKVEARVEEAATTVEETAQEVEQVVESVADAPAAE